ncbi:hypothetical protein, partial [Amycolatopsis sp. NPDC051716]|uniref:hypothetical protein n=1 Tax=Amycolatopsis sp. NPDC051716 TaxID=3155804 RepID=UPI003448DD7F
MKIEPGRTYRFRNKSAERYLSPQALAGDEATSVQILNRRDGDAQVWHVMPLDNDAVLIVNKACGRVLSPKAFDTSEATTLQILNLRDRAERRETQTWVFEDAGDGFRLLRDSVGFRCASPKGFSGAEAKTVQLLDLRDDERRNTQCWAMEMVDEEKRITGLEPVKGDDIGDVPRMTGYHEPPDRGPEVLVGQAVIPFPMVRDERGSSWQTRHNPYYLLRRYGFWKLVLYYEHSGAILREEQHEISVGLTTNNAATIEHTLGVSIGANAGIDCKGASASIQASMTAELKVTQTYSTETKNTRTETIKRNCSGHFGVRWQPRVSGDGVTQRGNDMQAVFA